MNQCRKHDHPQYAQVKVNQADNRRASTAILRRFKVIFTGIIRDIEKRPLVLTERDEALWLAVVDKATIATDGTLTFTFRNGAEVTA